MAAALGSLLLLLVVGAFLINLYLSGERERDLLQWESRLGLVADARADGVARLLAGGRRDLEELAGNASLKLYLWQVTEARRRAPEGANGEPDSTPAAGQLAYLRNLIIAAADRGGYLPDAQTRLPVNLPQPAPGGLLLLDRALRPVVVTPGLGGGEGRYTDIATRAFASPGKALVELLPGADDQPVLATALAVTPVDGTGTEGGESIGVLLSVRNASQELFPLLTRGPAFVETTETLLLVAREDRVLFLSPTRDGAEALRRTLPVERTDVAEVAAVMAPERFVSLPNHRGVPVLQVGRRIRGQDWVLVQQVDAGEALSVANERRGFLLATLLLLLVSIAALGVAAWRHGSSVRARQQAEELRVKAAKLQKQTDLLHTITDNLDVLTVLVDREQQVLFVNRAAALAADSTIPSLVGGRLTGIFGHAGAALLSELGDRVRRARQGEQQVLSLALGGAPRSFQTSVLPVERIGERRQLVLLVMSDVTDLQVADQRHGDLLRDLVATLSDVVALHDPWSAHHANRMTEVAEAVAEELRLAPAERATLTLAATLANIGKILLPSDLLTKTDPLSPAERELLRRHVDYSLELLKGLDFDGPVLEIIAQKQELLDGSGYPRGLTDEQLSLPGRILAVANAFVALVSARAYRQGVSIEAALQELMRGAGARYDRRVIAALFHVAANRRDWSGWAGSDGPPDQRER